MIQMIYLICVTFVLNFVILKSVSQLCNEKPRLIFVSTALATVLSIVEVLFVKTRWGRLVFMAGVTIWYICITFNFCTFKKFLRLYLGYMLAVLFYAGVCYVGASLLLIQNHIVFLVLVLFVYGIFYSILKRINKNRKIENFCRNVHIKYKAKIVSCKAFLDSGNLLVDPVTGKPVNLINFRIFNQLLGEEVSMFDLINKKVLRKINMAHYITLNTLGGSDKILVFQVEEMQIDEKIEKDVTFGLSLKSFNRDLGSDVILNNAFSW